MKKGNRLSALFDAADIPSTEAKLADLFAAAALAGLLATGREREGGVLAQQAWELADEMLARRKS